MTSEHGTNVNYTHGKCRCVSCTYAHAEYCREYQRRVRELARIGKAVVKLTKSVAK